MRDLYSKCGATCSRCPAYRANVKSYADRQRCSDGWHRYLGVRLNPERCYCDGCQTPDAANPILVIGKFGCNIRKCAVKNGVETCAHCSGYPCLAVQAQFSFDSGSRDSIAARLGAPVPDEDYFTFIEPYELNSHLEAIRASLAPEEIVEMAQVSVKPRTVGFPAGLPFPGEDTLAYEALHQLLANAGTVDGISYAEQTILREKRQHLVKILWAFGRFGEFKEDGGPHLELDSETYLAQRIHSSYVRVKEYFQTLEAYGVHCEHVPLAEKGWLTPMGALRKEGWYMQLSFDERAGGPAALDALQKYAARLDQAFGKQAFRRFSQADMQLLAEQQ